MYVSWGATTVRVAPVTSFLRVEDALPPAGGGGGCGEADLVRPRPGPSPHCVVVLGGLGPRGHHERGPLGLGLLVEAEVRRRGGGRFGCNSKLCRYVETYHHNMLVKPN